MKKSLLATLILSFALFCAPITAEQNQLQSPANKHEITYPSKTNMAVDAILALSAVGLGVCAIGTYRIANIPEDSLASWLKKTLDWINIFNLEHKMQLELNCLGWAGGSLSALSLLLLKKLSWEKNTNTQQF